MITPTYLKQGETIGIFAPARKIDEAEIAPALKIIEDAGFRVKLSENLFSRDNQFAGTDQQRAVDLQSLINDREVRAILCARGGYGTVRIIDLVDWKRLKEDPKWVVGYSDITVLHSHINRRMGMETLHATMPINFMDKENEASLRTLWDALSGKPLQYKITPHAGNQPGRADGILVGGNLSVLYSLMGSPSDIQADGKILFLEDLDEYLYHIDRMMMNIKRNGWLQKISGLVVGGMTDMNDNSVPFGHTAEDIIKDYVRDLNIPVAFGFPAGHIPNNQALVMGRKMILEIPENSGSGLLKEATSVIN